MNLLLDSFWRAAAYCLRPRVILLSLLPLAVPAGVALALGWLFWDEALAAVSAWLAASSWFSTAAAWLASLGWSHVGAVIAPLVLALAITPLVVVGSVVVVAWVMTPALLTLVASRRFPQLERKKGGSFAASIARSLGSTALAVVALVVSIPLWLIPPLILVLPPLIWGWLTYRVMSFDALAEHASREERRVLVQRHRLRLLGIGILTGYLGAAPSVVWASGIVFAAAFVVLLPVAIWIYTLVFAFSSLWFIHYGLAALESLRAEAAATAPVTLPTPSLLLHDVSSAPH